MKQYKLKDITELITCGVAKRPEYTKEGIMFLSSQNVKADKIILDKYNYISIYDYERLTKINKPEKGDILYTRVGSFGEAAVVDIDDKFALYVSLTLIKPKKELVNNRYLMHFLNSPKVKEFAKNNTRGIGVQNLNVDTVREFDIVIPSLNTQKKIVECLDKAQNLIDKRKEQIEALDELVKSKFIEMFGDPIINGKNYELKNLDEICLKITDGTHNSPSNTTEGVPYVTAKHLKQYGLDFYSEPTYVAIEDHEVIYKRCNPEKGDVLYIKDGATTGIAGINHYDFEFSMLSSLALLKLNTNLINNYYLVNYLNNDSVKDRIINDMVGGAIKRLTLMRIKNIKVVMPPIELQNQFADFVKQVDKLKFEMEKSLKELEDNFNSLMQKAFKGELFN